MAQGQSSTATVDAPETLPSDFFDKAPDTLPGDFFEKKAAAVTAAAPKTTADVNLPGGTERLKQAVVSGKAPFIPPTSLEPKQPSFGERLTSPDDPSAREFGEKHPFLGPIVRGASALGGTVLGMPGAIWHGLTDKPTPEEEKLFEGHTRIPGELPLERLTGAQSMVTEGSKWANPATRPTWEGVKSVLPEALGQGVGTVVGAELGTEALKPLKAIPEIPQRVGKTVEGHRVGNFDATVRELAGKTPADLDFTETLDTARADVADIARKSGFSEKGNARVGEFKEMLDRRGDEIWDEEHKPQVERHAQMPLDRAAIIERAKAAISDADRANNPAAARAADRWIESALSEDAVGTVGKADDMIRRINAEVPNLPEPFKNIGKQVRNAAVRGLRGELEDALQATGEEGVQGPNTRWGALREISNNIERRLNVSANKPLSAWDVARSARTPMVEGAIVGGGIGGALGGGAGAAVGGGIGGTVGAVGSIIHDIRSEPGGRIARAMRGLGRTDLQPPTVQPPDWVGVRPRALLTEGAVPLGNGPDVSGPVPPSERVQPMVWTPEMIDRLARENPKAPPPAATTVEATGRPTDESILARRGGTRTPLRGLLPEGHGEAAPTPPIPKWEPLLPQPEAPASFRAGVERPTAAPQTVAPMEKPVVTERVPERIAAVEPLTKPKTEETVKTMVPPKTEPVNAAPERTFITERPDIESMSRADIEKEIPELRNYIQELKRDGRLEELHEAYDRVGKLVRTIESQDTRAAKATEKTNKRTAAAKVKKDAETAEEADRRGARELTPEGGGKNLSQKEFFKAALKPVGDAWEKEIGPEGMEEAGRLTNRAKIGKLGKEESAHKRMVELSKPESFPENKVHVKVPGDGEFTFLNRPGVIESARQMADQLFSKETRPTPERYTRVSAKGPTAKQLQDSITKTEERIEYAQKNYRNPDHGPHSEQLSYQELQDFLTAERENLEGMKSHLAEIKP